MILSVGTSNLCAFVCVHVAWKVSCLLLFLLLFGILGQGQGFLCVTLTVLKLAL